ncbi:MAG: acetylornithine transaminase [Desulfobacterales bacterium]|jgi:acetylornithine aminotransferase|nr:acetylornithine transaminase [Desulfobacterales bacterium]
MTSATIERANDVIADTYKRFPVLLTRGSGCTLWDDSGRAYTDFVAGIAVCNLGHAHPQVAEALCRQARTLWHVSNLFYTGPQIELAAWLTGKSFADRVFFCNSGAEANEAAIKLARKYFKEAGRPERFRIISMQNSFHGRTMATLSATGQEKVKSGFAPLLEGFDFVPFDDLTALRAAVGPATAAVMLEPIQGEGGVRCPGPDYLKEVRALCDEAGLLLIFDEIQTGMGRTGTLFAYEQCGAAPDIMTLAKALANGLPMGAMLAREAVAAAFGPGAHASTFGGTPIVSAAALEVCRVFEREDVLAHAHRVSAHFRDRLEWLKGRHPLVEEVRGRGLLLGIRLAVEGDPFVIACMERGFLINCVQGNVLRFVPPLVIDAAQIDALIDCLDELFGRARQA